MYCPNPECVDVLESGRPGEYRDEYSTCPKCGARLVSTPPEGSEAGSQPASEGDDLAPCLTLYDREGHEQVDGGQVSIHLLIDLV